MLYKKLILLTGLPRSGTTWLGDLLSTHSQINYIFEPYSIKYNPRLEYSRQCRNILSNYLEPEKVPSKKWIYSDDDLQDYKPLFKYHLNNLIKYYYGDLLPVDNLLIKQPLGAKLEWVIDVLKPDKIIYLQREPFGIMNSYYTRNLFSKWSDKEYEIAIQQIEKENLQDFSYFLKAKNQIERFSSLYWGNRDIINKTLDKTSTDKLLIDYSELAENKNTTLLKIFQFLNIQQYIEERKIEEIYRKPKRANHLNISYNSNEAKYNWYYNLTPGMVNTIIRFKPGNFKMPPYPGQLIKKRSVADLIQVYKTYYLKTLKKFLR